MKYVPLTLMLSLLINCSYAFEQCGKYAPFEVQLPKSEGGFLFQIVRKITWARQPIFPVSLQLRQGQKVVISNAINEGDSISLSGVIKPGEYDIYSEVSEASDLWGAYGGTFTVAEDGKTLVKPQPIEIKVKMRPIGPDKMEVITKKRPTLKWNPQDGAVKYHIRWFEEDATTGKVIKTRQNIVTSMTEYTFDEDVVSGRIYEWAVDAYDLFDYRFAYYSSCYFKTP